jgi:general secretion pathway protein L
LISNATENILRIDQILQRWIEVLAALLRGMLETWRSRRSYAITRDNDGFVVRHGGVDDSAVVATIAPGTQASAEFIRAARRRFVTFELPADEIAVQGISVPARAEEFLAGVVHNQIDRLSPWPGDQVAYGFFAASSAKDPGSLDVRVLMTSRTAVDTARAQLAAAGLAVDRILAPDRDADSPVVLWSRLDGAAASEQTLMRRSIALSMIALLGLTIAVTGWAQFSAASMRSDSDELADRSTALQRQLENGRGLSSASSDPAEQAWNLKEMAPSAVMTLEALSRTIPDTAYLSELSLQNTTVRVTGLTDDAPSLIAPLEKSGRFADVHFFAPTTRAPDGVSFLFHIEGRTTPHLVSERD